MNQIRALLLRLMTCKLSKCPSKPPLQSDQLTAVRSVGKGRHQELLAYENNVVKTQLLRSVHSTCFFSSCLAHLLLKYQRLQWLSGRVP